jgi:flagellar protein FlbT
MPGLVLKLKAGERVMINGAVLENADRRAKITVLTPNCQILRLKDAIRPEERETPVRRVLYILQLMIAGEAEIAAGTEQVLTGISQLEAVFSDETSRVHLLEARNSVASGAFYPALRALRALLPLEETLLAASALPHNRSHQIA